MFTGCLAAKDPAWHDRHSISSGPPGGRGGGGGQGLLCWLAVDSVGVPASWAVTHQQYVHQIHA